jgi:hypothetical protein
VAAVPTPLMALPSIPLPMASAVLWALLVLNRLEVGMDRRSGRLKRCDGSSHRRHDARHSESYAERSRTKCCHELFQLCLRMLSVMCQVRETPMGGKAIRSMGAGAPGNWVPRNLWLRMALHAKRGIVPREQPHVCVNNR